MNKIISFLFVVFAFMACSSGSDKEKDVETYNVIGKWTIISTYTSDGYVTTNDNSYYDFSSDGTYTYYNGDILNTNETGTYIFNSILNSIECKEPRGWDFTIYCDFSSYNSAIFDVKGKTTTQSKIVKVQRK